ncbi:DUF1700 domain-containing protein [Holdemania massiliensis]|uniref:DUF1700 domain-containing protein n=1 Tax=Holdemania massiliensis TaxID=1468449 RepID=UPI001F0663FD|nr:DUF1700 domain-containing protein [Holdemania massiliensis]MCH1939168.1 DUF1700 domain-containing protein [Holdemania massiliensis]
MTKKEFLEKLEHKLHLLKHDEIQDILDEYSGYIDNKLQEGKTEDEAVADFGNLDDLAREILSAYKIDDKYTRDKSRDIIDSVVDGLTQGIDSAVSYFTQHFNDLSVEAVIRLIALILIALVVVGLMKIPFSLLETLTTGLLRVILPSFLAVPLNIVVRLAINLIYLCLVILLMASFITQGLENKEITLRDLIEKPLSFHLRRRSDDACSPQSDTSDSLKAASQAKEKDLRKETEAFDQAEMAEDDIVQTEVKLESLRVDLAEERILEDPIDPLIQPSSSSYYNERETSRKHGWGVGKVTARFMIGIVQLIALMVLIPFGIGEIALCFAFGLLVFLLIQGAKLWGVTLLCGGLIGVFQAAVSALWRLIHPAAKKRPLLISLIISVVLTGISVPLTMMEFSRYEKVELSEDFPEIFSGQPVKIQIEQTDAIDKIYLSFPFSEVVFREAPELGYGSVRLNLPPGQYQQRTEEEVQPEDYQSLKVMNIFEQEEGINEFQIGIDIFLRAVREGKWYTPDTTNSYAYSRVVVEASRSTLEKLQLDEYSDVLTLQP